MLQCKQRKLQNRFHSYVVNLTLYMPPSEALKIPLSIIITPFTESYMENAGDKFVQHYTGLPNFRLLKSVFDCVAPRDKNTKLSFDFKSLWLL